MIPGTLERWNEECGFSPSQFKILKCLSKGPATVLELVDAVYGDLEDGGPLGADGCIRQFIFQLNLALGGRARINVPKAYELTLNDR